MTVNTNPPISGPYAADGANFEWDFNFRADYVTHLVLKVTVGAGDPSYITSGFSATGLGEDSGGTVTYPLSGSALAAGTTVSVLRNVPYSQPTEIGLQGAFRPEHIEAALDWLAMQIQQIIYLGEDLVINESAPADLTAIEADVAALESDVITLEASDLLTVRKADDRTTLKAVDTTKYGAALMLEADREGIFEWSLGNFTSAVAADVEEGIYVKATAISAGVGAWVRRYHGPIQTKWFGPLTRTVLQAAVTRAQENNQALELPHGFYNIATSAAGPVDVDVGPLKITGQGRNATILNSNEADGDVFSITSDYAVSFREFDINTSVTKTAGTAAIRVNTTTTGAVPAKIFEHLSMTGAFSDCIALDDARASIIRDNRFMNFKRYGVFALNNGGTDLDSGIIEGNWFWDVSGAANPSACIRWANGAIRILNNRLLGGKAGIEGVFDNANTNTGPVFIVGNSIERQVNSGGSAFCVAFSRSAAAAAAGKIMGHLFITGNHMQFIDDDLGGPIYIDPSTVFDWLTEVKIDNNQIQNSSKLVGTWAINVGAGRSGSISENTIRNDGSGDAGIRAAGAGELSVFDNIIKKTGGTVTTPYSLSATMTVRDLLPWTAAKILALSPAEGSEMVASDGGASSGTLVAGSTGAKAVRLNGLWRTAAVAA